MRQSILYCLPLATVHHDQEATTRAATSISNRKPSLQLQQPFGWTDSGRTSLGEEHVNTLTSMTNLADVLVLRGRTNDAEELYRQALKGCRGPSGDWARLLGNLYTNCLMPSSGNHALGAAHPLTIATFNNLAGLYWGVGRLEEAEELYSRALEACRSISAWHFMAFHSCSRAGIMRVQNSNPAPNLSQPRPCWAGLCSSTYLLQCPELERLAGLCRAQGGCRLSGRLVRKVGTVLPNSVKDFGSLGPKRAIQEYSRRGARRSRQRF